jgi:hypothetical protein
MLQFHSVYANISAMVKKSKTIKKQAKEIIEEPQETMEDLPFAPPETRELSERYIVRVPVSQAPWHDRWQLRLYAEKELETRLGDRVQLTSLRVHKPHLISKTKARLLKREPEARLVVTIKF